MASDRQVRGGDRAARLRSLPPEQRTALIAALRETRAGRTDGSTIPRRPPDSSAPLSLLQQRFWFLEQLAPAGSGYHIPDAVRLRGRLDPASLAASLAEIARRHEVLRTRIDPAVGRPVQIVAPPGQMALPLVDLAALAPAARDGEAARLAVDDARRPFDLAAGPLWRALLLRLERDDHVFSLVFHHLVSDGWSAGLFWSELAALYPAFANGRPPRLDELPIQYGDFAFWQVRRWNDGELAGRLAAWKERLAGSPPGLPLPGDRPRPRLPTRRGAAVPVRLAPALARHLEDLARRAGATPFMLYLAAWQTLLHRLTGEDDLLVGVPVANRRPAETERLIGLFVNTLPVRGDLAGDPPFTALLARVRAAVLEAEDDAEVPFEKLVEELRPERDSSQQPLVQVLFAFEGAVARPAALPGLGVERFQVPVAVAPFDLALTAGALAGGGIAGWLVYATELFDGATARRWLGSWEHLLAGLSEAEGAGARLSDLPLLSPAERHQTLVEWTDTGGAAAPGERFHDLFAARAREAPDAIALELADGALSYGELDRQSRRLAARLAGAGVGPEVPVGVFLPRSDEAALALLAILRAGGTYLPLDVGYPAERIAAMLESSGAPLVVTRAELAGKLPAGPARRLLVQAGPLETDIGADGPEAPVAFEHAAYAIFTSGSTGRPKGVVVTHRNLANLAASLAGGLRISRGDRVLQFLALSFDASLLEIVWTLAFGGTLVVPPRESALPGPDLTPFLAERQITLCCLPASALAVLPVAPLPALRRILAGGEELAAEVAGRWRREGRAVLNGYGPTEATVMTNTGEVRGGAHKPGLGPALLHHRIHLLDRRLAPVPIGVPGEILVGGAGVSRGYLGRPDLTAERFLPDPFAGCPGARMYRTGDLARWRIEGEPEFLGRTDRQVKLRGFRIEPGEVEAALLRRAEVRDAVVLADTVNGRLVAWVVPRDGAVEEGLGAALRRALQAELPAQLVPSAIVALAALPRTPGGKVDRRALSAAALAAPVPPAVPAEGPGDDTETWVAALWREVLGVERVGLDDNFFDLGGHSLLLIQLHARLLERAPDLPLVELFRASTVRTQAARLRPQAAPERAAAAAGREGAGGAVAIIGLAGRFPGAADVEELWQNVERGTESITFFSAEELAAAGVDRAWLDHPRYVRANGVLNGIESFDAQFFGLMAREAEVLDPQHRLLLETAWEALESAGRPPFQAGSRPSDQTAGRVSVFVGVSANTYLAANVRRNRAALDAAGEFQATIANGEAFAATRLSYKLGLTGPSVHVQTACSTSLVAVHLACQSLAAGECDLAIAGGAGVSVPQRAGYFYQERGIASPDGHCRAFDRQAAGTVGGNGVGLVVLKPLAAALRDGDPIRAVIRGSAVNNDGARRVGFTAPGIDGQAEVVAAALAAAGVGAETIGYVEAHGSGTQLGDPIEIAALNQAFGRGAGPATCAVGSVKTNIGHLDAAAGVAGLVKAVLALERRVRPPSLHFEHPNPAIDFAGGPLFVCTEAAPWPRQEHPRRAGVSSFGIGGTNVHVVLEEAPELPATPSSRPWQLLLLSARSAGALEAATARLASHLLAHPELHPADVAYTLQVGRRAFSHRRALVCRGADATAGIAAELASGGRALTGEARDGRTVALLFPGLSEVRPGTFGELYATEPVFRAEVDRSAELLAPDLGLDLRPLFAAAPAPAAAGGLDLRRLAGREAAVEDQPEAGPWDRIEIAQPALFVAEYALARLWTSWGIPVTALLGYSLGEYAAACLAGVFTLADALRLVAGRARLLAGLPAGGLLAVPFSEERAAALPEVAAGGLAVAAVNGSEVTLLSGSTEAVAELARRLADDGIPCQHVATGRAFHSPAVEAVRAPLLALLRSVRLQPPRLALLSGVTGTWMTDAEATDPERWFAQTRQPVRLAAALDELLRGPDRTLLEVGPGQTLAVLARQHPGRGAGQVVVASVPPRAEASGGALAEALARLWLAGVEIDWSGFHAAEPRRRVPLPTYPFERRRYWIEPQTEVPARPFPQPTQPMGRRTMADWFYAPTWKGSPRPPAGAVDRGPETWLLLEAEEGPGQALAQALRRRGREVVEIGRSGDPAERLRELTGAGRPPVRVVFLHEAGPETPSDDRGFFRLLALAQALGELRITGGLELAVVTAGVHSVTGGEHLRPRRATLLGLAGAIPLEHPGVSCRSIDLEAGGGNGPSGAWAGVWAEALAEELLGGRPDPVEPVVALRGGRRWVPVYEPVRLAESAERPPRLREGGVYWITGGVGGIGLELAAWLAREVRARLVLTSRSGLPERASWEELAAADADDRHHSESRAIRRLLELEEAGTEILVLAADAADPEAMRRALARAEERFGPVHGVIHAAGLPGGGLLQGRSGAAAAAVLAPKVRGTLVLAELFRGRGLDFLALCSSLAAVQGGFGQADYCAANAFLDAFAAAGGLGAGTFTFSLGWDAWRDTGMAIDRIADPELRRRVASELADALSREEGVEVFRRALAAGLPHLLVSTSDLGARLAETRQLSLDRVLEMEIERGRRRPAHPRPPLGRPAVPPRDDRERRLAALWEEVLGIAGLGVEDEFADLGGHSLLALQLAARVRDAFGHELPMRTVFETPTVAGMAALLGDPPGDDSRPCLAATPLVALRKSGSRPPLFLVHPAGGGVSGYRDLARHLGPDQPVWAFQAAGLEDDSEPLAEVEALAARYLAALRTVAPAGPYYLGAWSLGGMIAYEMARQLAARGEEIALLALLDAHVPAPGPAAAVEDDAALLADLLQLTLEEVPASLDEVLAAARRAGRVGEDFGLPEAGRLLRVFAANVAAVQAYTPRPFPGRIALLRCREALPGAPPEPTLGWGALAAGGVEVHEVAGGHADFVFEPHVAGLAATLGASLAAAQARSGHLAPPERWQLPVEHSPAMPAAPAEDALHRLIAGQAARTPDATALVAGDEHLSYREIHGRAVRLARRLRHLGCGPERLVAVCLDRSPALVVALLGVLEAGAAYLPLDPAYPAERLAFLLADSGATVVLTEERPGRLLPAHRAAVLVLDRLNGDGGEKADESPRAEAGAANLAYVIYTSGSTGRPKGVAVTHGSACARMRWARDAFPARDLAGVFAATSICFDLSVFELFVPLACGGTVILGRDALALPELSGAAAVTLLNTVPSAAAELVRLGAVPPSVRTVNLAGEPLRRALADRILALPDVELHNLYGPTEDTTYSTWSRVPREPGEPAIGRPLPGTEVFLLDSGLQPVRAGVAGELFLGGNGLARCYLGRPDLTAERFLPHPFAGQPGSRLYRTGDLARHRPSDEIEYVGRIDHQVKVRGFRVEPGEIEAVLCACPGVAEAAVVARGAEGDRRLVAFVTLASGDGEPAARRVEIAEIRRFLAARLPGPLVPSDFAVLAALPRTATGKVDRQALPILSGSAGSADFARARGPLEERLAGIWAEVLQVEQVGIHDAFYDLGGHSLLAPRVVERVREALGVDLAPHAVLAARTVAGLAAHLSQRWEEHRSEWAGGVSEREPSPLVPLQPLGSQPPLFFLPPIGGGVASYAELARRLGPDQPSFGLQAPGLLDDRTPFDRLQPMAAFHLAAIRRLVPAGPYLLAGWSLGGVVAYEVAQQIAAAGGEVALLALLDTETVVAPPEAEEEDDAVLLADFLHLDAAIPFGGRLDAVIAAARRGGAVEEAFGPAQAQRLLRVFRSNLAALRTYVPLPYPGRVTLFRCPDRPSWETVDPADGWRPLARGGLEILAVPGDHFSLVHEPHAPVLAERLRAAIGAAVGASWRAKAS